MNSKAAYCVLHTFDSVNMFLDEKNALGIYIIFIFISLLRFDSVSGNANDTLDFEKKLIPIFVDEGIKNAEKISVSFLLSFIGIFYY